MPFEDYIKEHKNEVILITVGVIIGLLLKGVLVFLILAYFGYRWYKWWKESKQKKVEGQT